MRYNCFCVPIVTCSKEKLFHLHDTIFKLFIIFLCFFKKNLVILQRRKKHSNLHYYK